MYYHWCHIYNILFRYHYTLSIYKFYHRMSST